MSKNTFSNRLIKGRIAETIIQELFVKNHYNVFNYGMERVLPGILNEIKGKKDEVAKAIRSQPDFVVMHQKSGELFYVEVKFRANGKFSIADLDEGFPYKNAHFIIVSTDEIMAMSYKELASGQKICPDNNCRLENYPAFTLSKSSIEEYKTYVKDFFGFLKR